jgi:hypothetical protein
MIQVLRFQDSSFACRFESKGARLHNNVFSPMLLF